MKKIMMMAAVAMISATSFAQVWIGGGLNLSTTKDNDDYKSSDATIEALVGYDLNEKWAVAAELGLGHDETSNYIYNSWSITPFVRYNFLEVGSAKVFGDALVAFGSGHINGSEYNTNSLRIGVRPGFSYEFNEKIGLEATLGFLGWNHTKYDEYKTNTVALSAHTNFSLSFVYHL